MAVVLLIELDGDYLRGIVVNGGHGRTGLSDRSVFHSCRALASQPDSPAVPGTALFVEDYLSKSVASDLVRKLEQLGEPCAVTQGCTWWRLEQLVAEVQRGDWGAMSWGTEDAALVAERPVKVDHADALATCSSEIDSGYSEVRIDGVRLYTAMRSR
eukprot:CAMPEP_0176084970 /NCGR_PEP_ID=MMETSP0120_2-20121206/42524_1 /TAXON_ID=160619 /ORGANISM="Kryptoperidinium foliaceum, Strain CCMP 1326" /LENGTH=156 /DNA_ID=CAMNT_0017418781 /DNA_START=55 /DNA_END=521 /DNA_ORIENTATION=-